MVGILDHQELGTGNTGDVFPKLRVFPLTGVADDRILAVTAYPITGFSWGNRQVTDPVTKPSLRGRTFNRSMALDRVQVSNCRSRSSSSLERLPFEGLCIIR
jgi:hypothetical protein